MYSYFEDNERWYYNIKSNFKCVFFDIENFVFYYIEKKKLNYLILCFYKNGFVKSSIWNIDLEGYDYGLFYCLRNYGNVFGFNCFVINFILLDIFDDFISSIFEEILGFFIFDE